MKSLLNFKDPTEPTSGFKDAPAVRVAIVDCFTRGESTRRSKTIRLNEEREPIYATCAWTHPHTRPHTFEEEREGRLTVIHAN